jgi:hypothetical protein
MTSSMRVGLVVFAVVALGQPRAEAAEGEWETVTTSPITIKVRSQPNSPIKEIWAEGTIHAEVRDIQSTLMDGSNFRNLMPHVKESRFIGPPEADGSQHVYTRLVFPIVVSSRDYISRVKMDRGVNEDGTGEFIQHWVAVPDKFPARSNVVRVRLNEGSWHVKPAGDGSTSHVVYKFRVDPGGWLPAFASNLGNREGVLDTFKAVEKEAQKRGAARKAPPLQTAKP